VRRMNRSHSLKSYRLSSSIRPIQFQRMYKSLKGRNVLRNNDDGGQLHLSPCCAPYSTAKSSMALPENARGNPLCGNEGIANMRQMANDRHSMVSFCVTCFSIVRHLLMPFLGILLYIVHYAVLWFIVTSAWVHPLGMNRSLCTFYTNLATHVHRFPIAMHISSILEMYPRLLIWEMYAVVITTTDN
jgi:hypothetical protein